MKKKKIDIEILLGILGVLVAFLGVLLAIPKIQEIFHLNSSTIPSPSPVNEKSLTYENSTFKINYPESWRIETNPALGEKVRIFPKKSDQENFVLEVTINTGEIDKAMSLAEYSQYLINRLIKSSLSEVAIISRKPITLAKSPGYKIVYTGIDKQDDLKLKSMEVFMFKWKTVYLITYTAEENRYNEFLKPVEDVMISSFEVK